MPTIDAANLRQPVHAGEYGNYTKEARTLNELGGVSANTTVRALFVHAGTKVTDLDLLHEDMGASTTLAVGFEYVDPADGAADAAYFLAAASSVSAGARKSVARNKAFTKDAYITVTLAGGTSAAGKKFDLNVGYVYSGI